MKKLLFLDIDGVLHPNFSQEGEYFNRASYLVDALDEFSRDVEIIVSSSWRFQWSEDKGHPAGQSSLPLPSRLPTRMHSWLEKR